MPSGASRASEARELEGGHLHHAPEPVNPATGEIEDTDVGFPGEEHHIAERTPLMRVAMGVLAVLSVIAGVLFLPFGILDWLETFLEPTFEQSIVSHPEKTVLEGTGIGLTSLIAIAGIAVAYRIWVVRPGSAAEHPAPLRAAAPPVRQQVVLRRADRPARRAPVRLGRALGP